MDVVKSVIALVALLNAAIKEARLDEAALIWNSIFKILYEERVSSYLKRFEVFQNGRLTFQRLANEY
ncbi:hypothetical protein [Winogradskyella sp. PC D3.3]